MYLFTGHPFRHWVSCFLIIGFLALYPKDGLTSQLEITPSSELSLISALSDLSRLNNALVSYSETLGGSREAMSGISMMIFNDGYMLVSRPTYMRFAGIYEAYLDTAMLDHLWRILTDKTILTFDAMLIHNKIQAIKQQQTAQFLIVDNLSDAPATLIEIFPNRYQPAMMAELGDWNVKKNIAWHGLAWSGERYPDIAEIQYLLFVRQQLVTLMEQPDLKKIE